MAPVFRSAGTPVSTFIFLGSPLHVTIPACNPGDLLLLKLIADSATFGPVGWQPVPGGDQTLDYFGGPTGQQWRLATYTKRAVTGDAGTTVAIVTTDPEFGHQTAAVIDSYNAPFGVEQTAGNFNVVDAGQPHPQTMTSVAVTTERANQLIVNVFAWRDITGPGGTITSAPATSRVSSGDVSSEELGLQVSDQPQTTPGTTPGKSVVVSHYTMWASLTLSLYANDPPNAPTLLTPPDASTVNVDTTQRLSFLFSDPDPTDVQSNFDLRYRVVGAGSWTTLSGLGVLSYKDFAPGAFTDGDDYEWQVRCYDSFAAVGPWSASFTFTGASVPDVPTITAPTSDEVITDGFVTVVWSFPDQQGYQVRMWPDDGFGAADESGVPLYDTGQVEDNVTRSVTIPLDTTGITLHAQVSGQASTIWSNFADGRFSVDFAQPPRPTVTLTTNNATATITVFIANPTPTGDELPTAYNVVWVSADGGETWQVPDNGAVDPATMLAVNAQWTWWLPGSGRDYQVRVFAWSSAGSFSVSDPVDAAVLDPDVPDVLPPLIPGGGP